MMGNYTIWCFTGEWVPGW